MKRSTVTLAVTLALGIAVGAGMTGFVNAMQHVKVTGAIPVVSRPRHSPPLKELKQKKPDGGGRQSHSTHYLTPNGGS